jgi:Flp pilus assembly pilin Flp
MLLLSTTVQYIKTKGAELRKRADGVTAVEYALMVAIIALLMVAGFYILFNEVGGAFSDAGDCVADAGAVGSAGCPGGGSGSGP